MANLIAVYKSKNINAKLIMGFIDDDVNRLLVLENDKEASIAMVTIDIESMHNLDSEMHISKKEKIQELPIPKSIPLSREEIQYPTIWKAYDNSKLVDEKEVKEWINAGFTQSDNFFPHSEGSSPPQELVLKRRDLSIDFNNYYNIPTIGETILRRGSTRRFARASVLFPTLSSILFNSTRGSINRF